MRSPTITESELRSHLRCGVLEEGFARFHCDGCGLDRLVAFSCKGRGFCPSCGGRRMAALAAHLERSVLPCVPVRQWVLSLPFPLRFRLASDHALARALLRVFLRAVFALYRRTSKRGKRGRARAGTGAVTVIQRFGGALNLNVHFHVLVLDGLFVEREHDTLRFECAPALGRGTLERLLRTFVGRAKRLLARHGIEIGEESSTHDPDPHPIELDEPLLARVHGASLAQRVVLGERSGLPVRRIGRLGDLDPEGGGRRPSANLHARQLGFDLHAGVRIAAHDRARLEALCRYVLRPPVSHDRRALRPDGRIALRLKTPYRDGTTRVLFDPVELVEKLAALVPRPDKNLVLYHGVLAGNSALRGRVVAYGHDVSEKAAARPRARKKGGPNASWADLMRHAFGHDVLECPRCGERLRFLASIESGSIARAILRHLGPRTEPEGPARAPPEAAATPDCTIDPTFDFGP